MRSRAGRTSGSARRRVVSAPVVQSYSTSTSTTDSISCGAPSGTVAGDLLVAAIGADSLDGLITPPDGWTGLYYGKETDTGTGLAVFWMIATAIEPFSYTFSFVSGANTRECAIVRISGVNSDRPILDFTTIVKGGGAADANPMTPAAITTEVNKSLMLTFAFGKGDAVRTWTQDVGTELFDTGSSVVSMAANTRTVDSAGSSGTISFTPSNWQRGVAIQLAIQPTKLNKKARVRSSVNGYTNGTAITVPMPPKVNSGDLLVAYLTTNSATPSHTPAAGWTSVEDISSGSERTQVFTKTAGSSETNATFTRSTSGETIVTTLAVADTTGVDVHSSSALSSGANPTVPSVTTTGAGLVLYSLSEGVGSYTVACGPAIGDQPVRGHQRTSFWGPHSINAFDVSASGATATRSARHNQGQSGSPACTVIACKTG